MYLEPKDLVRFWSKVNKNSNCWNWIGTVHKTNYGQFSYKNKMYWAHRISYEICHGEIQKGLVIDHLCRNTICVNPEHLESVTNEENLRRSPLSLMNRTVCINGHFKHYRKGACQECIKERRKLAKFSDIEVLEKHLQSWNKT